MPVSNTFVCPSVSVCLSVCIVSAIEPWMYRLVHLFIDTFTCCIYVTLLTILIRSLGHEPQWKPRTCDCQCYQKYKTLIPLPTRKQSEGTGWKRIISHLEVHSEYCPWRQSIYNSFCWAQQAELCVPFHITLYILADIRRGAASWGLKDGPNRVLFSLEAYHYDFTSLRLFCQQRYFECFKL
jgi:hypothetical protein